MSPITTQREVPHETIVHDMTKALNGQAESSSTVSHSPIDVNIHGDIKLTGDGKNVNISRLIENDPMFVRRITSFVLSQIDSNKNGGKNRMWLDQPTMSY